MSEEKKEHVHVHAVRPRGTSAHTKEELEQDMNAGALEQGTFHLENLKGSTAGIVSPEELSGSNYDQTFLQGADVKTFEQATSYLTAKARTNNHYNVIRSNKLGERDAGVEEGSLPYSQHRSLTLDEPEYFDDNTSPGAAGAGSKAQLDTSSNRRKPFIHNKHYRERRDLGQHDIFTGGAAYKDTTTVDPTLIVGQETGFDRNNIEFPPYMIHASDRISSDGTIEAYPIRSAADRSNLQHPHTARGIKSDLNLVDSYRKSDTIKDQTEKLGTRQLVIGRNVDSSTSIICDHSNVGTDDTLSFTIRGITCTATVKSSVTDSGTLTGNSATIDFLSGDNDKKLAENLEAALVKFRELGVRIRVGRASNVVFVREALDRARTKGVIFNATDNNGADKSFITSVQTCGGFTIEFHKYPDLIYEGSKTRALSGYNYYLDGVESFGIEVLNDAERVKLLTSSIANPDSEDPDDRIRIDAYIPWLLDERSGTYGESHVGPINTQGFIAPEHTSISFFEDDSDMDVLGRKLSDDNTFASKPNFFLTDERTTITGNKYLEKDSLVVQSSWIHSATPFVTSSHIVYGPAPTGGSELAFTPDKDGVHQLSSKKSFAKSLILFDTVQPEAGSVIEVKDSLENKFDYTLGVNTNIESSVTLLSEEYGNKINPSTNANATVQMRGTQARITHTAMPEPGSTITMTLPSLAIERDHFQMVPGNTYVITNNPGLSTSFASAGAPANSVGTSFVATANSGTGGTAKVTEVISLTKTYVYKIDGTTGELDGDRVVVIREGTTAKAIENLEAALASESGHNAAVVMPTSRSGSTLTIPGLLYSRKSTASSFRAAVEKSQGETILAEMENQNQVRLTQRIVEFNKLGNHTVRPSVPNPNIMIDMTSGTPTRSGTFTPASSLTYQGSPTPATGQELVPQAGGILKFFRITDGSQKIDFGTGTEWDAIIGNNTSGGSTQKMTCSAWIYKEGKGPAQVGSHIIDFGNRDIYFYIHNSSNDVRFRVKWENSQVDWFTATNMFSDNTWTHVAVTYDANSASNSPKIYVNGQVKPITRNLVYGTEDYGEFYGVVGQHATVGNASNGNNQRWFEGKIAAVYVVNEVLNELEIRSIMSSNSYSTLLGLARCFTTISGFDGGSAKALSNTGVSGSISFNKESPYFPESNHYGFKSSQGVRDKYPAVSVISGSHHFSGRKNEEVSPDALVAGQRYAIKSVGTDTGAVSTVLFPGVSNDLKATAAIVIEAGTANSDLFNKQITLHTATGTPKTFTLSSTSTTHATQLGLSGITSTDGLRNVIRNYINNNTYNGSLKITAQNSNPAGAPAGQKTILLTQDLMGTSGNGQNSTTASSSHLSISNFTGGKTVIGQTFTATGAALSGDPAGKSAVSLSHPKFSDDAAWTTSYWMSGSDERADHFRSVRDVFHFMDTTGNGSYDTTDHYPNVPNFSVRHFMRRDYGFLYVSLYDNDFYPNNHHRVDFIFAGVREGVNKAFLRNSPQENALYNAITGEDSWNHFSVSYDGAMHSTNTHTTNYDYLTSTGTSVDANSLVNSTKYIILTVGGTTNWQALGASSNTPSVGEVFTSAGSANGAATGSDHGTAIAALTYENFLQALENEDRHSADTISYGPNIFLRSSADTLIAGKKYVVVSAGDYGATEFNTIAQGSPGALAVNAVFTASGNTNPSGKTATVRAKSEKHLEDSITQTSVVAGSFRLGTRYTIADVGSTDFTLIGAPSNTVGASFIATGPGTGDGVANTSASTRTLLYNYGVSAYEPYAITGSLGGGKLSCPVRLYLNGVDITDNSLEYITHNSVRTSGYSDRYGKDYVQTNVAAKATITITDAATHTDLNGDQLTLNDGNTTVVFTINNTQAAALSGTTIGLNSAANEDAISDAIIAGINAHAIGITASDASPGGTADTAAHAILLTQDTAGAAGNTNITSTLTAVTTPAKFTGGLDAGDFRDIQFSGEEYTLAQANAAAASGAKAFSGHTVMSSSIVFGGDPNATSFNTKLLRSTSENDFVDSTKTHVRRRVHANQNTNTISEFAMWGKELSGDQIKAVWELSRYNDVLFTVQKPMAEALSRMRSSFEDGVDKGHRHSTKGFVFGDTEHGTDSIVYGGLKK